MGALGPAYAWDDNRNFNADFPDVLNYAAQPTADSTNRPELQLLFDGLHMTLEEQFEASTSAAASTSGHREENVGKIVRIIRSQDSQVSLLLLN